MEETLPAEKTTVVETETKNVELEEKQNCCSSLIEKYNELMEDQDFRQKLNVSTTLILEFYRVLMGSLLILMVPQKCNDHICTIDENMNRGTEMDYISLTFNFATLASMLVLYYIEVKRENKMITYLEVNIEKPRDDDAVAEALLNLPVEKKESILKLDKHYCNSGYASILLFLINSVVSFITIMQHYLDSKTLTVLLTNILFMGSKLSDVMTTVKTDKNIFYSAYLIRKVQYNDVDPDKFIEHPDSELKEGEEIA